MESIYWIDRLDHIHDLMQLIVLLLFVVFMVLVLVWLCTEKKEHLDRLLRFGLFWLLPAIIIGLLVKTFLPTTEEKYKELHEAVGAYGSPCVWQCRFDSCTATQEPGRGARTVMSAPQPFFINELIKNMDGFELIDTVGLMLSADYKERFVAEYRQLLIRKDKLSNMLQKWNAGVLGFIPNCSIELLEKQECLMSELIDVMEERASFEGINFSDYSEQLKSPDGQSQIELLKLAVDTEQKKSKAFERRIEDMRKEHADELEALQKATHTIRNKNDRVTAVLGMLLDYLA